MSSYPKVYIFDFDGTLVESNEIKKRAFFECLPELERQSINKIVDVSVGNRFDILRVAHYTIKKNKRVLTLDERIVKFNSYTTQLISNAPEVRGAKNFLSVARRKKIPLFISSATPTEPLRIILEKRKIFSLFDGVFGSPDTKVKHIEKIKELVSRSERLDRSKFVFTYFGDSKQDMISCRETDIKFHGIFHNFTIPHWATGYTNSYNFINL